MKRSAFIVYVLLGASALFYFQHAVLHYINHLVTLIPF